MLCCCQVELWSYCAYLEFLFTTYVKLQENVIHMYSISNQFEHFNPDVIHWPVYCSSGISWYDWVEKQDISNTWFKYGASSVAPSQSGAFSPLSRRGSEECLWNSLLSWRQNNRKFDKQCGECIIPLLHSDWRLTDRSWNVANPVQLFRTALERSNETQRENLPNKQDSILPTKQD